jgi:hypothetical protein
LTDKEIKAIEESLEFFQLKWIHGLTSGLCYNHTTVQIYKLCAWTNVRDYERKIYP